MLDRSSTGIDGRVALVTGAGAGIGRAIALAFARFGAKLLVCDRNEPTLAEVARLLDATGSLQGSRTLDVRDHEALASWFEAWSADGTQLDVLVNNAGGTFRADFDAISAGGQRAIEDLNFRAAVDAIRLSLPRLRAGASIINVTTVEAHRAAPGYAIYAAMKAALENLTRSLALELGTRRIRVNCIAPDAIPTPGVGDVPFDTPLSVRGEPDDVASAALYLASDLSRFVTGTTLHVDGGTHAAGGWRRNREGAFEL